MVSRAGATATLSAWWVSRADVPALPSMTAVSLPFSTL